MENKLIVGLFIGAMVGGAVGGFIYKSRANFDADLVAYQNLAPVATLEPTATSTPIKLISNCLTPSPTETPETAQHIAAVKAWNALEKSEIALHANDFIPMPNPKINYDGIPVEFFASFLGPSKWRSDLASLEAASQDIKEKSPYEKFYGILGDKDKTIINGFKRRTVFDLLNSDEDFDVLHKPFYGIKAIYYPYGDGCCLDNRPSPNWIYIVWSVKHKAPIPFPYPEQAAALVKRQSIKR